MQVQEAFIKLRQELAALYDERESEQIAHWVIENITGYSRSARILHKTDLLTTSTGIFIYKISGRTFTMAAGAICAGRSLVCRYEIFCG